MEGKINGKKCIVVSSVFFQEAETRRVFTVSMEAEQGPWPGPKSQIADLGGFKTEAPAFHLLTWIFLMNNCADPKITLILLSCTNNYMPNNQFKKGELYSFITGKASTAIARRLQKKFNAAGLNLTIEQWSVLYHLWKQEGISQQELCNATFRDKPSITRLVDNLERLDLVKRVPSDSDRRINLIYLTKQAQKLQEQSMELAEETLNEALETVPADKIEVCKEVLQVVYDNLK
jgi:DNA-binding MarR family transcriptional regulator